MRLIVLAGFALAGAAAPAPSPADYAADANSIGSLITANYAYLDHLPGGEPPTSPRLIAERDAVHDRDSLLHYAEDVLATLADHHAITGPSFKDDWAVVPTYSDLWVVKSGDSYLVDSVREESPAAKAGIRPGDRLVDVGGQPIDTAVAAYWERLGLEPIGERAAFAARILAAGRRDRQRVLTFASGGRDKTVTLDSLYGDKPDRPPFSSTQAGGVTTIKFNNSLGDLATIPAFDAAMARIAGKASIVLDFTDTPSGGNTAVARAIMSWFVRKPTPYQMHQLPAEERETGIKREWVEYVLPRAGKFHAGPVSIRAGRWTGSMGEGLAIGFMALGRPVCGTRMAGLRGAVYDFDLPRTGLRLKFPAERLYTVAGEPREAVVLKPCRTGT